MHYQAHLERISDYLQYGPGVWWKDTFEGIEFFDCSNTPQQSCMPPTCTMHFRSKTLADVDLFLQQKWEECIESNVILLATTIRQYSMGYHSTQMVIKIFY